MVVADDEIDALAFGVGNFINGLNAAVKDNDEFHPRGCSAVNAFIGHAIAVLVAVGDEVIYVGVETVQKFVHQRYRRASVHIVVSIY